MKNNQKVEYTENYGINLGDSDHHPKAQWGNLDPEEFLEAIDEINKKDVPQEKDNS